MRVCAGRDSSLHDIPAGEVAGEDSLGKPKQKAPPLFREAGLFSIIPGGDLLSHIASHAVPSAQRGLTSVFEMGTGVTPSALPPRNRLARKTGRAEDRKVKAFDFPSALVHLRLPS